MIRSPVPEPMAVVRPDFTSPRLHVETPLDAGVPVALGREAAHYLRNVLRLETDDTVLAFNGRDGEWRCALAGSRSRTELVPAERCREQPPVGNLLYGFALLKHARLDYLVQKAVEMGASVLQPLVTRRTQAARVNLERMRANVVEAAQQCGVLTLPEVREPVSLPAFLAGWPPGHLMVFCDEDAETADPIAALRGAGVPFGTPVGVVIGPEGGFDETERRALLALPHVVRLSLGPRILRADTAAVAALALVQAVLGDGNGRR